MKKLIKYLLISLTTISLSACSVFNNPATSSSSTAKVQKTEAKGNNEKTKSEKKKKDKNKTSDKKNKAVQAKPVSKPTSKNKVKPSELPEKEPVNNTKSESGNKASSAASQKHQSPASGLKELQGEWLIQVVSGQKVKGDDRPYIFFDINKNVFYGNNGCNVINGALVFSGTNGVKFENVAVSMRLCQPASPTEFLINNAMADVAQFAIETTGDESLLNLRTKGGRTLIVLRRHNLSFANGAWQVKTINSEPADNPELKFVIDIPERKIHGYGGCNIINGKIFIDPDKSNSIQFQNLNSTRMTCPDAATESKLLIALEETISCHCLPDGTLVLRGADGLAKVTLIPIEHIQ